MYNVVWLCTGMGCTLHQWISFWLCVVALMWLLVCGLKLAGVWTYILESNGVRIPQSDSVSRLLLKVAYVHIIALFLLVCACVYVLV